MKEIRVTAADEQLSGVLAFIDEQLEAYGCPMKTMMQIEVAVEEVFVNIAHYAYTPEVGEAVIRVDVSDEREFSVTFIDSGIPYDPLAKPDPDVTLSAEERQIGGLGIYMVKKSMDEVRYEHKDGRNMLTLIKKI